MLVSRLQLLALSLAVAFQQPGISHAEEFRCGVSLRVRGKEERVRSPWTALLFRKEKDVFVSSVGAVIVGPSTLVTIGRNFWKNATSDILVGVGIPNRNTFQLDEFTQILKVAYIRPHPGGSSSQHHFAVVQLKSKIMFSNKVRPICVPSSDNAVQIPEGPTRVSGFRRVADYSLFSVDYKIKAGDLCSAKCHVASCRKPIQGSQEPGNMFIVGSVLSSWHIDGWLLAGLVVDGDSAFLSHIAGSKSSLAWIHTNIRNAGRGYTCLDGQLIPDLSLLCNGQMDCKGDGGSDEEPAFCQQLSEVSRDCNTEHGAILKVVGTGGTDLRIQVNPPKTAATNVTMTPQTTAAPKTTTPQAATVTHTHVPTTSTTKARPTPTPTPSSASTLPNKPDFTGSGCAPMRSGEELSEGTEVECRLPSTNAAANAVSTSNDCRGRQPFGTKMRVTCAEQYKPAAGISFAEWTCEATSGVWTPVRARDRAFSCVVECGVPQIELSAHIVNGTNAFTENWPWRATIFRNSSTGAGFLHICGATLIGINSLLTAAHCLTDSDGNPLPSSRFRVALTPRSVEYSKNPKSKILAVASVHVNLHYNPVSYEGDIGIIKTAVRVQISASLYPACYPVLGRESEQIERYQTSVGGLGLVVGFQTGAGGLLTDKLKKVQMPVVSVRDCFKVLDIFPSSSQICAGHTTGVSVCNGDSGSGLLFQEEGARKLFYVQGIVSHGPSIDGRYCDYNRYSIFTRVGAFRDWIEEILTTD